MRFPHFLFGFPMTIGLWYVIIVLGGLLILWLLSKIFKNLVKDFAGGAIIFVLIFIFILVVVNLVSGADSLSSGVDNWFNRLFQ